MATKPTERILDWASGGTTTDPGGAKEAAGWVVDDRPPANWWNWILNSFGKWLSYFEEVTDGPIPIAVGRIQTDATPVVHYNNGPALAATPVTVFASALTLDFASAIVDSTVNTAVQVTQTNINTTRIVLAEMSSTSQLTINFKDTDGVSITDVNSVQYTVSYAIWGTPA